MKDTDPRIEVLHRMRPGVATAQQVLDALDAVDPLRKPVERNVLDAARDGWDSVVDGYFDDRISRAIAAADRARGRSYVKWQRPEEWTPPTEKTERYVWALYYHSNLALGLVQSQVWANSGEPLYDAVAWMEVPAPPAWAIADERVAFASTTVDGAPTEVRYTPDAVKFPECKEVSFQADTSICRERGVCIYHNCEHYDHNALRAAIKTTPAAEPAPSSAPTVGRTYPDATIRPAEAPGVYPDTQRAFIEYISYLSRVIESRLGATERDTLRRLRRAAFPETP